MNLRIDRQGRRLIALKQSQQRLALAAANAQAQMAQDKRLNAEQMRAAAADGLQAALPQPEQGLSRGDLYERLRLLAVARAHALETSHAANELEEQAMQCDAEEHTLRQQATDYQRKQEKLDQWRQRSTQQAMRQRDDRRHRQQLEDHVCHRHLLRD